MHNWSDSISIMTRRPALAALLVFAAALTLYTVTLAPGLLWGGNDFALYQTWAYLGETGHALGAATHPLWVRLAHPLTRLPLRDVAWRANFTSAILAAAALLFVYLSAWQLTRSRAASMLAAGALGVSHVFWTYAVVPKAYSLNALFLSVCSYLLLVWRNKRRDAYLCLFAFIYGLSLLNHLVLTVVAAGFAAFIVSTLWPERRSMRAWRSALLAGTSFAIGLLPCLYLLWQAEAAGSVGRSASRYLAATMNAPSYLALIPGRLGWGLMLAIYQFPATFLVGLAGLCFLWRRERSTALLITLGAGGVAVLMLVPLGRWLGGDVFFWSLHFYLHAYVIFALALAPGFQALWERWCRGNAARQWSVAALTIALPVMLYAAAPAVARSFWPNVPGFRSLPGRDNFAYALSPWKNRETGARSFGMRVLEALPAGAVLFADYSIWSVIHYLQVVDSCRPDITLVQLYGIKTQVSSVIQYRDRPDLFLADANRYYDLPGLGIHFRIIQQGPVHRLVPR